MPKSSKGIFCIEGDWWGVKDSTTVEPVLQLLRSVGYLAVPYIHRNAGTHEEFKHYLQKWTTKGLQKYPILYLGFHGEPGVLRIGEGRGRKSHVSLDDVAELLAGKCKGKIIHFGSCSTLDVHGHKLNAFRRRTGALAVLGYRTSTDWIESAAFEVLLLGEMQSFSFTKQGIKALKNRMIRQSKQIGFHFVV
jgi:hypothetical protein